MFNCMSTLNMEPESITPTKVGVASTRRSITFQSLHDIEVILCLSCLDLRSIFTAARVCRRLHEQVRAPLLWQEISRTHLSSSGEGAFRIKADEVHHLKGGPLEQYRYPICIQMAVWEPIEVANQLKTLASMPNILRFELTIRPRPRVENTLGSFINFFGQPTIRATLKQVVIIEKSEGLAMSHSLCQSLTGIEHLESLTIESSNRAISVPLCNFITKLPLRHLNISISFSGFEDSWLGNQILRSASLASTLTSLSLRRINFSMQPGAYPFSQLKLLEILSLDDCNRVGAIVEDLGKLAHLRRIHFTRYSIASIWQHGPSIPLLQQLQRHCGSLELIGLRLKDRESEMKLATLRTSITNANMHIPVTVRTARDPPYE